MAGVPRVYRIHGSNPLVSYDYVDIATGQAIKTVYGTDFENSSYALHGNTIKSHKGYTLSGVNGALDLDFDMAVEKQLKIEGRHIVYIPLGMCSTSGTQDVESTVTVSIRKFSNGSETHVASEAVLVSATGVLGSEGTFKWATYSIDCPKTNFTPGDLFRTTIETTAPGANRRVIVFHDPMNMDPDDLLTFGGDSAVGPINPASTTQNTQLKVDIPLKIAL